MTEQSAERPTRSTRAKTTGAKTTDTQASTAKKSTAAPRGKAAASPAPTASRLAVAVPVMADSTADDGRDAAGSDQPMSAPTVVGDLAIQQGGIGRLTANDVAVTQGGIGAVRADRVSVEQGGIGAAMADQLVVRQGVVGAVIAGDAQFEQAGVRTMIANRVTFGPSSGAVVVIAARVEGNVRPLFDWRAGLAFGLAAGLLGTILRARRR